MRRKSFSESLWEMIFPSPRICPLCEKKTKRADDLRGMPRKISKLLCRAFALCALRNIWHRRGALLKSPKLATISQK